jgi:hypothetical protein
LSSIPLPSIPIGIPDPRLKDENTRSDGGELNDAATRKIEGKGTWHSLIPLSSKILMPVALKFTPGKNPNIDSFIYL